MSMYEGLNVDGTILGTPPGVYVYPVNGGYVVADEGGWVEGSFSSIADAVAAARPSTKPPRQVGEDFE